MRIKVGDPYPLLSTGEPVGSFSPAEPAVCAGARGEPEVGWLSARARSRLAYAGLYTAIGAPPPFSALCYQLMGLGFGQIAVMVALGAIAALLAAPAWGLISDRL